MKRRKANWIGHIYLLKHVTGGKIEGGIYLMEEQGRRRKQLLEDIGETIGYWKLKHYIALCEENWLWKRLWTCRKTDCGMNEWMNGWCKITWLTQYLWTDNRITPLRILQALPSSALSCHFHGIKFIWTTSTVRVWYNTQPANRDYGLQGSHKHLLNFHLFGSII